MPVRVNWANPEQSAILITITDRWTWRVIETLVVGLQTLDSTAKHPYDLIIDGSQTTLWEPDLLEHARANYGTIVLRHRRMILIVGVDEFTRVLIEAVPALPGMSHLKFVFFETVSEALVYSASVTDSSKPDKPTGG